MSEPMSDERPRCGTPCLKHAHACDRSPRHTGWHRDVQQKGDHTCEWDTPGPKDFPALMAALRTARAELAAVRAELAAWQTAGNTTDLAADAADHLATLADWETETGSAPDWLVTAVVDLLTPITIERDRLARERDAIARADKAGERRARQMIDGLTEKIHRARGVHAPQCGGGCAAVPCECEPGDLVCAECGTPAPCATARALDGEETDQS